MSGYSYNPWETQFGDTFIARQIRRSNRNLQIGACAVIIAIGSFVAANWRYAYNFAAGPFAIEADRLRSVTTPDGLDRYFLTVEGDESFASGITEVESRVNTSTNKVESETTNAEYLLLGVGNKLLVVKAPPSHGGKRFSGGLIGLPSDVRKRGRLSA